MRGQITGADLMVAAAIVAAVTAALAPALVTWSERATDGRVSVVIRVGVVIFAAVVALAVTFLVWLQFFFKMGAVGRRFGERQTGRYPFLYHPHGRVRTRRGAATLPMSAPSAARFSL